MKTTLELPTDLVRDIERRASQEGRPIDEAAARTRILYGGSVKANNVAGFLASGEVDGVLVGGASLDADEFAGISRFQKHIVL